MSLSRWQWAGVYEFRGVVTEWSGGSIHCLNNIIGLIQTLWQKDPLSACPHHRLLQSYNRDGGEHPEGWRGHSWSLHLSAGEGEMSWRRDKYRWTERRECDQESRRAGSRHWGQHKSGEATFSKPGEKGKEPGLRGADSCSPGGKSKARREKRGHFPQMKGYRDQCIYLLVYKEWYLDIK